MSNEKINCVVGVNVVEEFCELVEADDRWS